MSPIRLSSLNGRVIHTPARPAVRSRVLVVSSDSLEAHRLRAVLLRGHFAAQVADPEEVVAAVEAGDTPDVIVLDMADPDLDGLGLCQSLRTSGAESAILMLHPEGELDDLLDGYEAGTDAYLTGPVDHRELFQRIDALTGPQALLA